MTNPKKKSLQRKVALCATILLAAIGAGAQKGSPAQPVKRQRAPLQDDLQTYIQKAISENAKAVEFKNWNASGYLPEDIFKLAQAKRSSAAWTSLCQGLSALSTEDLALFEGEIAKPKNRSALKCAQALTDRMTAAWEESRLALSQENTPNLSEDGKDEDLTPLTVEERPINVSQNEIIDGRDLKEDEIAITLDGGPHPTRTIKILSALHQAGARAHFFNLGRNAQASPDLPFKCAAQGNIIGAQGADPADLAQLDMARAEKSILVGRKSVEYFSMNAVSFFRFPFNSTSEALQTFVRTHGMTTFSWNIDSQDWKLRSPVTLWRNLVAQLDSHKSGIILFHDTQEQTAIVMPHFLTELQRRGKKLVVYVPERH